MVRNVLYILVLLLLAGCDDLVSRGPEVELARASVAIGVAMTSAGLVPFPGPLPLRDNTDLTPIPSSGLATPRPSEIEWVSWADAHAIGKPTWFHFTGKNCGPCQLLEKQAFSDPEVVEASRQYSCVRLTKPAHLAQWGVKRIPYDIFVTKEWKVARKGLSPSANDFAKHLERGPRK